MERVIGIVLVVLFVIAMLALSLVFIAGAILAGYKAYLAFTDGRETAALLWAVLCFFCAFVLFGSSRSVT